MKVSKKIYALGFFDGVHLGHQALLRQCVRLSAQREAQAAAITFDRHPQALFSQTPPALLQATADRVALLRHYGAAHIRLLPVTEQTMGQNWKDFLNTLVKDGAVGFVCGHDFRFGCKGEGTAEKLRQFCAENDLPCVIVPEQTIDGVRISSTHIRCLIEQGDVETAAAFLGHRHTFSGRVVAGRQIGRSIGVPTANILIHRDVVVPRLGVYACLCDVGGKRYSAVTNIGSRPTVGGHQVRAESWLLDFEGDLYGKQITLELVKFLRPERKFASLEELKAQIQKDAAETYKLLR